MDRWLTREIPSPVLVLVFVFVAVLTAIAAQATLRRAWPRIVDGDHNDVAGFLIAIVGVIYAVLAGFLTIAVWEEHEDARSGVEAEAAALGDLVADSVVSGDDHHTGVVAAVAAYTDELATVEWPAMEDGGHSERAGEILQDLRLAVYGLDPSTTGEELAVEAQLDAIQEAGDRRSERLSSNAAGLPAALWLVLVTAASVVGGFALLFGLRDRSMHFVMVGSTSGMLALSVAVVVVLNFPFVGDLSISPDAFEGLRSGAPT